MPVLLWSHGGILCATTTLQYVMRLCSVQFGLLAVQAYVPYSRFEFCITEPEFLEYLIMDHIDVNHPLDNIYLNRARSDDVFITTDGAWYPLTSEPN